MEDINEMIADAKAEEQAKQEMKNEKFRKDLKHKLAEMVGKAPKVEVDLEEYTLLKINEMDLIRLMEAITADLTLSYSKEDLRLYGDNTVNAFRVLFSDTYEEILEKLKAEAE